MPALIVLRFFAGVFASSGEFVIGSRSSSRGDAEGWDVRDRGEAGDATFPSYHLVSDSVWWFLGPSLGIATVSDIFSPADRGSPISIYAGSCAPLCLLDASHSSLTRPPLFTFFVLQLDRWLDLVITYLGLALSTLQ